LPECDALDDVHADRLIHHHAGSRERVHELGVRDDARTAAGHVLALAFVDVHVPAISQQKVRGKKAA
jgi:hypothetical protein